MSILYSRLFSLSTESKTIQQDNFLPKLSLYMIIINVMMIIMICIVIIIVILIIIILIMKSKGRESPPHSPCMHATILFVLIASKLTWLCGIDPVNTNVIHFNRQVVCTNCHAMQSQNEHFLLLYKIQSLQAMNM